MLWANPAAAVTSYYSYYDPIYDSGVVEEELLPKGISLGDSVFGKAGGVGGFLSSFKLHADAATSTNYTDNAKLTKADRQSDIAQTVNANVAAESDWERHQLRFGANGGIKRFRDAVSENQNGLNLFAGGRIDITDVWSLNGSFDYAQSTEQRGDPQETNAHLSHLRKVENTGGGVGIDYRGDRFAVATHGTYKHIVFEKLDGEAKGFRNRDVSRYFTRVSYPLNDDLQLYIQPAFSREIYYVSHDASGVSRDSKAYELLAGVAYNVTDLTVLDIGVGQIRRTFDDTRLNDAQGLSVNASLRWSPYENFSINSAFTRTIESTTLTGVNDLVVTSGRILPSLALTPEIIVTGEFGVDQFAFSDATGTADHDYLAGIGLNYLWSDSVNAGIRYRYRHRLSDVSERDFYSNTILLTLACSL